MDFLKEGKHRLPIFLIIFYLVFSLYLARSRTASKLKDDTSKEANTNFNANNNSVNHLNEMLSSKYFAEINVQIEPLDRENLDKLGLIFKTRSNLLIWKHDWRSVYNTSTVAFANYTLEEFELIEKYLPEDEQDAKWLYDRMKSRYKTCAFVGNGGFLQNSKCGLRIDSHQFVARVNNGPTEYHESDVGMKTSTRFAGMHFNQWHEKVPLITPLFAWNSVYLKKFGFCFHDQS